MAAGPWGCLWGGSGAAFLPAPAHPAGTWGKLSYRGVCVLLRGFGWGHEGITLPMGAPNPGRSPQQLPPGQIADQRPRDGALGWFPCRVGLAPAGKAWIPTMSRPKQLTGQGQTLPHPLPVPCRILPEPLQAPHPFESAGRMSTCFCRGFIAGC